MYCTTYLSYNIVKSLPVYVSNYKRYSLTTSSRNNKFPNFVIAVLKMSNLKKIIIINVFKPVYLTYKLYSTGNLQFISKHWYQYYTYLDPYYISIDIVSTYVCKWLPTLYRSLFGDFDPITRRKNFKCVKKRIERVKKESQCLLYL